MSLNAGDLKHISARQVEYIPYYFLSKISIMKPFLILKQYLFLPKM